MTHRPSVTIGVSACLIGCPVRYDGGSFGVFAENPAVRDVAFVPVCPECMAGLTVPRRPIRLTGTAEHVLKGEARVIDDRGTDVTEALIAGARACQAAFERAGVRIVVLKELSPSCGLAEAPIGPPEDDARGRGVFTEMLVESGYTVLSERMLGNVDPEDYAVFFKTLADRQDQRKAERTRERGA